MAKSMTGYGRSQQTIDNYDITVEIKSVNHRYADYNIRVPRAYNFLEEHVKAFLQKEIARGKIDIYLTIYKEVDDSKQVTLNVPLAESYIAALKEISRRFDIPDDITVSAVARNNDIFDVTHTPEAEDEIIKRVEKVLGAALDGFTDMRAREGEKLAKDMLMRNGLVQEELQKIEAIAPETVIEYRKKIEERILELLNGASVDENRLLTETAIYADKLSITEEITRLHSHLGEFDRIMALSEPIGRKLDFLLQEMNREINTIGSKSNNLEIAKLVVNIKSELEKIREQLQNIE